MLLKLRVGHPQAWFWPPVEIWQAENFFWLFDKFAQTSGAQNNMAEHHVAWNCQRFIGRWSPLRWSLWSFHSVLKFFPCHYPHRSYCKNVLTCIAPEFITYNFYAVVMLVPSRICFLNIWIFFLLPHKSTIGTLGISFT